MTVMTAKLVSTRNHYDWVNCLKLSYIRL